MSGLEANPFGDPVANPFADPSVRQAAGRGQPANSALEGYNPFADEGRRAPASSQVRGASNPPIIPVSSEPPPAYSASGAQQVQQTTRPTLPGHDDLLRRQEELEKKAAELRRQEEELQRRRVQGGEPTAKNWPPLPAWSPVQPCFYQDINIEIPQQFQRLVRLVYYLWLFYAATLVVNVIGAIAYLAGGGSGVVLGVSIVQVALFTPCSFVLWYRPLYKAFRSDSSFNFMVFFFVMFVQLIFVAVQALGLDSFGTCGWINTLGEFRTNIGAALVMLIVALAFTATGLGMLMALFRVHRIYRSSGASFAKAQQEFSQGVTSNPYVQSAAVNVASSAVQSQMSGGRY